MSSIISDHRPVLKVITLSLLAVALFGGGAAYGSLRADPQPHMREALLALKSARGHLEAASADKGGHRARAIELVTSAMEEVQAGMDYDNRH